MDDNYFKTSTIEERLSAIENKLDSLESNIKIISYTLSISQHRILNNMIRTKNPVPFKPSR